DRWIPDAATCAAAKNAEYFLGAVAAKGQPSAKLLEVTAIVAEHYARGGPVDSVGDGIAHLTDADPQSIAALVRGLMKGWPADKLPRLDDRLEQNLERLMKRLPREQRGRLIKVASAWGSKKFEKYASEAAQTLLTRVKKETLTTAERLAAARELV